MSKKKVGIAFSDFVTEETFKHRVSKSSFVPAEIFAFAPLFFLVLLFSLIFFRLFYIQIIRGDYYRGLANTNRTRTTIIPAPRGIIYDIKGRTLVNNSPSFEIIEKDSKGKDKIKRIDKDEALKLIAQGKKVENDVERNYLFRESFAQTLGYVGQISDKEVLLPEFSDYSITDYVGKMGLEKEYEGMLHGKNGKELFEVNSKGEKVRSLGREEPQQGESLNTTLNLDLELAANNAFANHKKGAVVVSDPRDGSILALYSKPNFDPNIFTHSDAYTPSGAYSSPEGVLLDSDNHPFLNRAISGTYPPGSTFKLITAIAGLETGAIKADTQIQDTGVLKVGASSFGNWYWLQYGKTEGSLNVVGAIKRSNDIFFYKTAEEAGVEGVSLWAKNFGLGETYGIDMPGEAHGTVPDEKWKKEYIRENWYLGDTYNYGIGQGYLLTTPLQVNMWTSVFANDGTLYKPHLVKGQTKILKKNLVKKEYADLIREGMFESCATGGVAWPLFDFKVNNDNLKIDNQNYTEDASGGAKMVRVKVGCKTGTAQIGGEKDNPHAWITAFAPFYNPEVVVTVLVENGGEGSSIAGPIARDILKEYFEKK